MLKLHKSPSLEPKMFSLLQHSLSVPLPQCRRSIQDLSGGMCNLTTREMMLPREHTRCSHPQPAVEH